MDEAECKAEFCVEKNDLHRLTETLQIPGTLKCYQGTVCDGMDGLCMLLKRLSYPCRFNDMISRFGRPVHELCMTTNPVMDFIYVTDGHRITQSNPAVSWISWTVRCCAAIAGKGGTLDNCFGFVDGTVRPVSKPGEQQTIVYNGHKRVHALKFQSVAVPNGLIANVDSPVGMFLL